MTPYTLKVPLNYANPDGATITVFFRIVNDIQRAGAEKLPWLLFLQGTTTVQNWLACIGPSCNLEAHNHDRKGAMGELA